jgi:hypothetical protein
VLYIIIILIYIYRPVEYLIMWLARLCVYHLNYFKFHWHNFSTIVHLNAPTFIQKIEIPSFLTKLYPHFHLELTLVCVLPKIFSKSIDKWLWKLAHLFTVMPQNCTQVKVTLSSILTELCPYLALEFMFKFAYHLKYVWVH